MTEAERCSLRVRKGRMRRTTAQKSSPIDHVHVVAVSMRLSATFSPKSTTTQCVSVDCSGRAVQCAGLSCPREPVRPHQVRNQG